MQARGAQLHPIGEREPQTAQQAAERAIELEAPATPASLNDLGDGPIESRADTAPRVYVGILERNGR